MEFLRCSFMRVSKNEETVLMLPRQWFNLYQLMNKRKSLFFWYIMISKWTDYASPSIHRLMHLAVSFTGVTAGFTLCLVSADRCGKDHSGPESLWSFSVVRSWSWRLLHRGGQGGWPESRLWCRHTDRREGPPVPSQVADFLFPFK